MHYHQLGINTGWAHTFFVFCISDLCTFCLIGKLGLDGDWVVGWGGDLWGIWRLWARAGVGLPLWDGD